MLCSSSLTSVRVCCALFSDPKGRFESSAKFLNPTVVRNQPHIFLQFACTMVLRFSLSFIWGPHGCTLAYSQLCVLNHLCSQCCSSELRGMCLGNTKACEHPSSVWGFTTGGVLKRGKPVWTKCRKYLVGLWEQPCRNPLCQGSRVRWFCCWWGLAAKGRSGWGEPHGETGEGGRAFLPSLISSSWCLDNFRTIGAWGVFFLLPPSAWLWLCPSCSVLGEVFPWSLKEGVPFPPCPAHPF